MSEKWREWRGGGSAGVAGVAGDRSQEHPTSKCAPVPAELKNIYTETAELAAKRLEDFERGPWGKKIPAIAQCWRRVWDQVIPFFAYPKRNPKDDLRHQ